MNTKYFPMSETIGFEIKSAKDIFAAKELGMTIRNEDDYGFDDMITYTNEDGEEEEREPTEGEMTNRVIEHMNNGGKVYATIYSSNYMLVDKRATTLQTNFFIGQEVFFMENNKICKGVIYSINFKCEKADKMNGSVKRLTLKMMYPYSVKEYEERDIFTSKEELIEHLIED